MIEYNYTVYCHTNKTNNKKYIGITRLNPEDRWKNGIGYKIQPKFWRAIQKYGWDGFYHEILCSDLQEQQAKDLEIYFIKELNTVNNGYNVSHGGDTGNGVVYTDEMKQHLSEKFSGEGNPRYGVVLSDDIKNKIRSSLIGRECPEKRKSGNPMARKVVLGNLMFGSILELSEYCNIPTDTIQMWLSDDKHLPPQFMVDIGFGYYGEQPLTKGFSRKDRHMITICEGIEFKTATDCANYYKIKPSTMVKWLNKTNPIPKEWQDKGLHYKPTPKEILIEILRKEVSNVRTNVE